MFLWVSVNNLHLRLYLIILALEYDLSEDSSRSRFKILHDHALDAVIEDGLGADVLSSGHDGDLVDV